MTLREFLGAIDLAVMGLLEPRDAAGHPDLPGYRPYMGPRYGFPGLARPLSVFRGEGVALFALAQAVRPKVVAETFTGTAYSSCWLAAGAPEAAVWTVDNWSEGTAGDGGYLAAAELRKRLFLRNLRIVRGTNEDLRRAMGEGIEADLVFLDGLGGDPPQRKDAPVATHDCPVDGAGPLIRILGGSHLHVRIPGLDTAARLATAIGAALREALGIPDAHPLVEVL